MSRPADENLPEVVPSEAERDVSPQATLANNAWPPSERDKYPVLYDPTPKLQVVDDEPAPKLENGVVPNVQETLPAGATAPPNDEAPSERKICGLRRRVFFVLAAIISVVLLAAIIGGAVGGSLSNKSSSQSASQTGSSAGSQESPSDTTSGSSTSSSSSAGAGPATAATSSSTSQPSPTGTRVVTLNNGTAPNRGLAFQGFSSPSYLGSATPIIQKEGFHDLNISAQSYVWFPDGTQCCLTFCANKTTALGYWCNPRYRPDPEAPFARVYIWCDGNDGVKNLTCS
jgi:hypothetical protein